MPWHTLTTVVTSRDPTERAQGILDALALHRKILKPEEERMSLEQGWHVLMQDVENLNPDRRSKAISMAKTWRAGQAVYVEPPESKLGRIVFPDRSFCRYGEDGASGEELSRYLMPVPFAIGQLLRDPFVSVTPAEIVALAFQRTYLTLPTIRDLIADIEAMSDEEREEFHGKHWLSNK